MSKQKDPEEIETITITMDDINWIKNQLLQQSLTLLRLNQTIVGDKEYGQKGLVEQLKEHQKYIDGEKDVKAKIIGGIGVVGVFWTLLLKFWDKIF